MVNTNKTRKMPNIQGQDRGIKVSAILSLTLLKFKSSGLTNFSENLRTKLQRDAKEQNKTSSV